ncbi:MAG: hypothetical protein WCE35_22115 [Bradyrhizobium sp.]
MTDGSPLGKGGDSSKCAARQAAKVIDHFSERLNTGATEPSAGCRAEGEKFAD